MRNNQIKSRISKVFSPYKSTGDFIRSKIILFFINLVISSLILYLLMFSAMPLNVPKFELGSPSPLTVITPKTVSYVDQERTNELYEKIKSSVKPVYRLDTEAQNTSLNLTKDFFGKIQNIFERNKSEQETIQNLISNLNITQDMALIIVKINKESITEISKYSVNLLSRLYINGVRSDNFSNILNNALEEIENSNIDSNTKQIVKYVINKYLVPNLIYDSKETEKAISEALKNVPPIKITIQAGTTIISKGEIVNEEHIEVLKQIGYYGANETLRRILIILLISVIYSVVSFYAILEYSIKHKKLFFKKFLEYLTLFIISSFFVYFGKNFSNYLVPINLFAFMIYAFSSLNATLILAISFAMLISFAIETPVYIIIPILISSIISLVLVRRATKVINYIYAGIIGGTSFVILIIAHGLFNKISFSIILTNSIYGFVSFFVYIIISLGIIFLLEHAFNEITAIRLLELSNTDNPILKELLEKAPGTYQHSMLVASVVSAASEAIKANALLAKVGAYYHDIGKIVNPVYFTENQSGGMNIHNTISPFLSKSVIINHVKDGIAIAKKFRLPQEIIDFIETHHGKTVVSYFYQKAKESDSTISKDDFRYPGPLPKTKETAILLLTDAVEAASHSLDTIDYRKVEELVNTIIDDRIEDGQLSESELTFAEITKIKESFVKSLLSLYHRREKYPNGKEKT